MDINVKYLGRGEVGALGYFKLLDMRYQDRNSVTKVLQLYLI